MMEVAAADIQMLGGSVELVDIGKQKVRAHRILPGGWEEAARSWVTFDCRWSGLIQSKLVVSLAYILTEGKVIVL